MDFIKFEEKQWNKRGRICYANPYQIYDIHWPASADGAPVNIYLNAGWKVILDETSIRNLAKYLADDLMTEERREVLIQNAIAAAKRYKAKEKAKEKTADSEEKQD